MNDKPAMANTQAFAVITQDELSSLRAELAELRAQVSAQNDRLAHIAEYWNGERNDQAMYDALCHIVDEAGSALPVPQPAMPEAVASMLRYTMERIDKSGHILLSGSSAKELANTLRAILSATETEGRKDE